MKARNHLFSVVVVALSILTFTLHGQPKNVILLIGDGMGPEQVRAASLYLGEPLGFQSFPYEATCTTYAANAAVTDSAAAASAIATGVKVNYGVISLDPNGGAELETLLEWAQSQGKEVGLVTTTYLTHATPAAFGAHSSSRNNYSDIANDYLSTSRPNVLFGGGKNGLNVNSSISAGYDVAVNLPEFLDLDPSKTLIAGQFGESHLPYVYDHIGDLQNYPYPMLDEMVVKALAALEDSATPDEYGNDPGLFLMVEGGRIDHACHDNHLERAIYETLAFADAVDVAVQWAATRSENDTLILVTADHETGGLWVDVENSIPGQYPSVDWNSTGHTATDVPVYAMGPNAELVRGVMDNTDFFTICTVDNTPVYEATNPYPGDGLEAVPLDVILSWTAGSDAQIHRVYFGSGEILPLTYEETLVAEYVPHELLEPGSTYSWRVDEVRGDEEVAQGVKWTFSITSPPGPATALSPSHLAIDVSVGTLLTWVPGDGAVSEETHFGEQGAAETLITPVAGGTFDPGPLDYSTTYEWKVVSINSAGQADSGWHQFTTSDLPLPTEQYAVGEDTAKGTVAGSLFDTYEVDGSLETLTEVLSVPNKNGYSTLDHTWTFTLDPSVSAVFYVNAFHDESYEGDDFTFSYSTDGDVYHPMLTITRTIPDTSSAESFDLPGGLSGNVYIRVTDTDHTKRNQAFDSLYVDRLCILASAGGEIKQYAPTDPIPADGAVDIPLASGLVLQWTPGDDAEFHDVYFASEWEDLDLPVAQDLTALTYMHEHELGSNHTYYWRVDERDEQGNLLAQGAVWTFTTADDGNCTPTSASVDSVSISTVRGSKGMEFVQATVVAIDNCGHPVEGETVTGAFTVDGGSEVTAFTDSSGVAVLTSSNQTKKPDRGFSVISLTFGTI